MQVRKQQLELDMEQWSGSKSGKDIQRQEEIIGWMEMDKAQRWMTREENDGNQKHKVYFSGNERAIWLK